MGWGHLVRSVAIADEVVRLGAPTTFAVDGDTRLARELGAGRHRVIPLDSGDPAATLDAVTQARGQVVLLDGYSLGDEHEAALADAGVFVATLDDFGHASHPRASLIVNSNLHYASAQLYPHAHGARLLLGPAYAPLRSAIVSGRTFPREARDRVEHVMVVMGGSDAGGSRERVLRVLQQVLPAGAQLTIAGQPPAQPDTFEASIDWVRTPEDVAQSMARADVGISAGGMTSYEFAYMGVPALLLPATAQESPVSRELEALGCAICLPQEGRWQDQELAGAFRRLCSSRALRESMTQRGQAIFDGRGAARIAQALVDALAKR